MRNKWVIGNWKMNPNAEDAKSLFESINSTNYKSDVKVGIAPPSVYLASFLDKKNENLNVGSQNVHFESNGAFTGELSVSILESLNADICLVGHSERRAMFGETDEIVRKKVEALLSSNVTPIFCVGEELSHRKDGKHLEWVYAQVRSVLEGLKLNSAQDIVVAYEPVWAIGTGEVANEAQIDEMHAHIRKLLTNLFPDFGADISILYGGSCKPENAKSIFEVADVDGALVGGASLKADSFEGIINAL